MYLSHRIKTFFSSWVWGFMPIVPMSQEAEVEIQGQPDFFKIYQACIFGKKSFFFLSGF
jgi:hypothetical protein